MRNKLLVGIIVGFMIIVIAILVIILLRSNKPAGQSQNTITVTTKTGESLSLNDFSDKVIQENSAAKLIGETDNYRIVYFPNDQSFNITLLKSPFASSRSAAEQALLDDLGIPELDVCKLRVSVGISYDVDQALSGQEFGLSFCPDGKAIPDSQ